MGGEELRVDREPLLGRFRWITGTDTWRWSRGMYSLHGYEPEKVRLTLDLVLDHKTSDARERAGQVLERSRTTDQWFNNHHTIVDTAGETHTVVSLGVSRVVVDRHGSTHRVVDGFMADVTDAQRRAATADIVTAREHTAAVQQALGLLMGMYGVDEGTALAVLRRHSSHNNVKVRDLAARLVQAATSGDLRSQFDGTTPESLDDLFRAPES